APKTLALDSLIREVVRPHELVMQAKSQTLDLELDKVSLEADAEKLRSILDNLIGNAVKFTPPGGCVTVTARASGLEVLIDVIDSGPGVPPEEREAIFDSFFRGRAQASGRIEGTGLGLAIAREFAEAHGGRISVITRTSGGHFRATLPPPLRDDARAAELLEPLAESNSGSLGRFAGLLAAQIGERQRLAREVEKAARERANVERERQERDKREEALRAQLEALRAIERGILDREERLRRKPGARP